MKSYQNDMNVSVIFATHNREDVLGKVFEAWKKVNAATKYSYEIICSDDESTDHTVDIIKAYMRELPIRLIQNKKGGAGKARNAALEIAIGEIVIFTGDDMFPQENFVNAHYENYIKFGANIATLGRIEWHPEIKLNHLMKHITEIGCEQFGFIGLPPYQMIDFRHFYTSNISVSKKLLESLDCYFNTDFDKYGFEDIELGYRLQKIGMKIYYDPDILIYHHHIYNSAEKFCERQISAGEELVVFSYMHDDLEDKCICDVENCRKSFLKYKKKNKGRNSFKGSMLLCGFSIAKAISKCLEILIEKGQGYLQGLCSFIYIVLFKNYFYYGIVLRIAQEEHSNAKKSQIMDFAYNYMKCPVHELYWDVGYSLNENDARKWICWDDSTNIFVKKLPDGVLELRIAPLKDYCKAWVNRIEFILRDGKHEEAEVFWHNACRKSGIEYDFTHTDDSCISIKKVPENYEAIEIEMKVEYMKTNTFIKTVKSVATEMYNATRYKVENAKKFEIQYAYGQRRRIQICIAGNFSEEKRKELIKQYQEETVVLGNDVFISDVNVMERGYTTYIYDPQIEPLDITQFLQVAYTLLDEVLDYVLVSKNFAEYPLIGCKDINDVLIYNKMLKDAEKKEWLGYAVGRYMRLPAYLQEKNVVNIQEICPIIRLNDNYCLNIDKIQHRISERTFGKLESTKPLVFVIPIFFAVGGVERNTIEIMRQLKEKYDFCLITLERHIEQQGSLHYQLKDICRYIFDLREITEHDNYMSCLYELKQMFQPQLLWLCNNSPWFEQHTRCIRELFSDVAIVAQDVYDTKRGWIEYYKNPEVKTFDRYIAITELIKEEFINTYKLPDDKIDVIYSVIDDRKIRQVKSENISYDFICEKYGLDKLKMHFGYVARLTMQKNPIRYLKLVKQVLKEYDSEAQFVMVGDGDYKERVNEYVKKNCLEEKIVFIPYVENTPELIGMLDGLIITSDFEGLPIVCIEAMCMGTPILSTDTGDTRRFIEKNVSGLIIDEKRSDLDNFIEFYINLKKYTINAKLYTEEMVEYFSAKNIAEKYYETFQKAIENVKNKKR